MSAGSCARAALAAVALLAAAAADGPPERKPNATYYQQGVQKYDKDWNAFFKARIPKGQCTADLQANWVCRDPARPYALNWLVMVVDDSLAFVHMLPRMTATYIFRDEANIFHGGNCSHPAWVRSWAHCAERPYYNQTD